MLRKLSKLSGCPIVNSVSNWSTDSVQLEKMAQFAAECLDQFAPERVAYFAAESVAGLLRNMQ
jgi:hypothetical protein